MEQKRKTKVNLPFENRKEEPGEWAYDHRVGLFVVVIIYLAIAIIFLSAKILIGPKEPIEGFVIDIQPDKEQQLDEQLRGKLQRVNEDFSDVRNLSSNDNAKELNERLKDSKGTDASKIYNEADEVQGRVRANREAYDRAMREEREMIQRAKGEGKQTQERQDSKVKGRVTVSFSFTEPVRSSQKLYVPAYRCEAGGEVVVNATLARSGSVTSAVVDRANSSSDHCLCEMAVEAALSSRFNINQGAPERHKGTITYIFIPQ